MNNLTLISDFAFAGTGLASFETTLLVFEEGDDGLSQLNNKNSQAKHRSS